MVRPKKIASKELVRLVDEFFANEAAGNPAKLKCSMLEQYAKACGADVKAYDFRRDESVRIRIEELKSFPIQPAISAVSIAYKNLDITEMIRRSPDLEVLKKNLLQMDSYWKEVYESAATLLQKNKDLLAERKSGAAVSDNLKADYAAISKQLKEVVAENSKLWQENVYLRKQLKLFLYPALADELLREQHLPAKKNTSVKPAAFSLLIDGKQPSPFPGTQVPEKKVLTREERLIEQMKAQVEKDGV